MSEAEFKTAFESVDTEKKGAINKAQFAEFLGKHAQHKEKAQEIADVSYIYNECFHPFGKGGFKHYFYSWKVS